MRSWSANTASCDMKGDFVLDSPLVVSYLCSVLLLPCLSCAQLQAVEIASLLLRLSLYGWSKMQTALKELQE